jgi:hypothetical protein
MTWSGFDMDMECMVVALILVAERPFLVSWSWLFGQVGSEVKVYSGC